MPIALRIKRYHCNILCTLSNRIANELCLKRTAAMDQLLSCAVSNRKQVSSNLWLPNGVADLIQRRNYLFCIKSFNYSSQQKVPVFMRGLQLFLLRWHRTTQRSFPSFGIPYHVIKILIKWQGCCFGIVVLCKGFSSITTTRHRR